jgi:hypothetical protein
MMEVMQALPCVCRARVPGHAHPGHPCCALPDVMACMYAYMHACCGDMPACIHACTLPALALTGTAVQVATRRVKQANKADIPLVDDHVSKIEHIGRETVRKLVDLQVGAGGAGGSAVWQGAQCRRGLEVQLSVLLPAAARSCSSGCGSPWYMCAWGSSRVVTVWCQQCSRRGTCSRARAAHGALITFAAVILLHALRRLPLARWAWRW